MTLDPTLLLFPQRRIRALADPWRDLLLPALLGGQPWPPDRDEPDDLAAWIRCLLLRGDPDRARRLLPRALSAAHPDSLPLAGWLQGRAPPPPRDGPDWQQADACCDRATWLRLQGDRGPARHSLLQAVELVPHHAEACLLLALGPRPLPPTLRPHPGLGWYSPFRVERRLRGGAWMYPDRRDRPRVQAGIRLRLAPADDPRSLRVDALADHLRTRCMLGLPTGDAAARLWAEARRLGPPTTLRSAGLLCRVLPPHDRSRRAAAEVLDQAGLVLPSAPPTVSPQLRMSTR